MNYNKHLLLESIEDKQFRLMLEMNYVSPVVSYITGFWDSIKRKLKNKYNVQTLKQIEDTEEMKAVKTWFDTLNKNNKVFSPEELKQMNYDVAIKVGLTPEEIEQIEKNTQRYKDQIAQSRVADNRITNVLPSISNPDSDFFQMRGIKEQKYMNNKIIISEQRLKQIIDEEIYNILSEGPITSYITGVITSPAIKNAVKFISDANADGFNNAKVDILLQKYKAIQTNFQLVDKSVTDLVVSAKSSGITGLESIVNPMAETHKNLFGEYRKSINALISAIAEKFPNSEKAKEALAAAAEDTKKAGAALPTAGAAGTAPAAGAAKATAPAAGAAKATAPAAGAARTASAAGSSDIEISPNTRTQEVALSALGSQRYAKRVFDEVSKTNTKISIDNVKKVIDYLMKSADYKLKLYEIKNTKGSEYDRLIKKIVSNTGIPAAFVESIVDSLVKNKAFNKVIDTGITAGAAPAASAAGTAKPPQGIKMGDALGSGTLGSTQNIKEHLKKRNNYELLKNQLLNQKENYA